MRPCSPRVPAARVLRYHRSRPASSAGCSVMSATRAARGQSAWAALGGEVGELGHRWSPAPADTWSTTVGALEDRLAGVAVLFGHYARRLQRGRVSVTVFTLRPASASAFLASAQRHPHDVGHEHGLRHMEIARVGRRLADAEEPLDHLGQRSVGSRCDSLHTSTVTHWRRRRWRSRTAGVSAESRLHERAPRSEPGRRCSRQAGGIEVAVIGGRRALARSLSAG